MSLPIGKFRHYKEIKSSVFGGLLQMQVVLKQLLLGNISLFILLREEFGPPFSSSYLS